MKGARWADKLHSSFIILINNSILLTIASPLDSWRLNAKSQFEFNTKNQLYYAKKFGQLNLRPKSKAVWPKRTHFFFTPKTIRFQKAINVRSKRLADDLASLIFNFFDENCPWWHNWWNCPWTRITCKKPKRADQDKISLLTFFERRG